MKPSHQRLVALAVILLVMSGTLVSCERRSVSATSSQPVAPVPPAIRYDSHVVAGGAAVPGAVLRNPNSGNSAVAKSGAALFLAMNCDGCHGGDGSGWVGPSLADGRWRYGGSDSEIFNSIYYGHAKGMPAFGGVLGIDGVWTLVTYIESLPLAPDIATESWDGQ